MRILLLVFSVACLQACKKNPGGDRPLPEEEVSAETKTIHRIIGVDQFGRNFHPVSSFKTDKQVGLFFWLWIGQPYASNIYDASKILDMPNGLNLLTDFGTHDEMISPNGQAHFWGKPLWGYYNSEDEWVLRKQMEMLTIAGVDFIFFDATNAFIYKNVFLKLLAIVDEFQKSGWHPPKVVFYTHSRSLQTIRELYKELYKPGLFPDTWYRVDGKPMIIGYTNPEDDIAEARSRSDNSYVTGPLLQEVLNFFHFARPQWPSDPVYPDGFPWVEWIFPQPVHNGVMNVTVASHPSVPMSFSLTRGLVNWGRGWNPDTKTNVAADVDKGTFFQRQWDHALLINPNMITIGGWNEWIAYKQPYAGEYVLVDAVNKEYSRDIEPMEGGYEDAFYLQMIRNIRRYKGIETVDESTVSKTIDINAGIDQWKDIPSIGVNINDMAIERDANGASAKIHYAQPAPENLIREIKVAHDANSIYFFIKSKNAFSAPGATNWLNILLGTGQPGLKSWQSYEYVIGKQFNAGEVTVGKLGNDFNTTPAGMTRYHLQGDVLQIECPRSMVNLNSLDQFYFKVAAGVQSPADIMSYYTSGSVLPIGRLSYLYKMDN